MTHTCKCRNASVCGMLAQWNNQSHFKWKLKESSHTYLPSSSDTRMRDGMSKTLSLLLVLFFNWKRTLKQNHWTVEAAHEFTPPAHHAPVPWTTPQRRIHTTGPRAVTPHHCPRMQGPQPGQPGTLLSPRWVTEVSLCRQDLAKPEQPDVPETFCPNASHEWSSWAAGSHSRLLDLGNSTRVQLSAVARQEVSPGTWVLLVLESKILLRLAWGEEFLWWWWFQEVSNDWYH